MPLLKRNNYWTLQYEVGTEYIFHLHMCCLQSTNKCCADLSKFILKSLLTSVFISECFYTVKYLEAFYDSIYFYAIPDIQAISFLSQVFPCLCNRLASPIQWTYHESENIIEFSLKLFKIHEFSYHFSAKQKYFQSVFNFSV